MTNDLKLASFFLMLVCSGFHWWDGFKDGELEVPENAWKLYTWPYLLSGSTYPVYESSSKSQRLNLWTVSYESLSPTNIAKHHILKHGQNDNDETKHQQRESELFLLNSSEKEFGSCLDCLRHSVGSWKLPFVSESCRAPPAFLL